MLTFILVLVVISIIARVGALIVGVWLLFKLFGWVHQWNPRLAFILVCGFVVIGGIAHFSGEYLKRTRTAARAETRAEARAEERERRRASLEEADEQQALAVEALRKSRADLVDRWRAARRTAIRQWREDLENAHAVGKPGVTPPMLSIEDNGSLVSITNRAQDAACVLVTRVAARDSAVLSRCTVGGNLCLVIQGGATARWVTLRTGNSQGCLEGALEYRVGNVDHPDPSWWSQSALDQFGSEDPDPELADRWSDAMLRTETQRLEQRIQERMRVER